MHGTGGTAAAGRSGLPGRLPRNRMRHTVHRGAHRRFQERSRGLGAQDQERQAQGENGAHTPASYTMVRAQSISGQGGGMKEGSIRTVVVVGAGIMGRGIALASARAGFKTSVIEPNSAVIESARGEIDKILDEAVKRCQGILDAARKVRNDILFLSHGGPIATPEDAAYINERTDCVGFVGASSLERLGVEQSLVDITRRFKKIPTPAAGRFSKRSAPRDFRGQNRK